MNYVCMLRRQLAVNRRGQSMVEFAMVMTVALLVLLVSIQMAMIGQAALAVSQVAWHGARYASVNPTYTESQVRSYMVAHASPTIATSGGSHLTITVAPAAAPRTFGQPVTVNVSFEASPVIVLPNPFLGISFPSTLSSQQTAMSE
ncbi:MAG: TadE/TadG family type IV pilus assembly protein [Candidatus Binataceae bacterium]